MKNNKGNNTRQLLTTEQTADMLSLSPRTLQKWRCEGTQPCLKFIKIGGRIRYLMGDVSDYIDGLSEAANDE